MMIRAQIQLTEDQMRRVRGLARQRRVSVAEVIRQAVDAMCDSTVDTRADRYARAASLVGRFADREGATDVSTHHDDYLAETYG